MTHDDLPRYELYALRYATRDALRSQHFMGGDPHDGPMPMDFFIWAAKGPERTFVIDLGFSCAAAHKRNRGFLQDPVESLRLIGVDPLAVEDVILTHLHYDHAGNFGGFPNARFHIQEDEMQFATGRYIRYKYFSLGFDEEDVVNVVRLNFAQRIEMHRGTVALAPGIEIVPAPGHTPGQQVVRVHTGRGWVVLASDAAHYYENIQRKRPFASAFNVADMIETFERVLTLAGGIEHVVPGHDPLVMQLYPPPSPELLGKVVRLDVPPLPMPARPKSPLAGRLTPAEPA